MSVSSTFTETGTVRIFISSTFKDMQAERDRLVNRVFPQLRKRFRATGIELVDVDLRWGITEEQAERRETLAICLTEIDRCRPFFIGLLGDRYGSVLPPDKIGEELKAAFPILHRSEVRSITELEFEYGALAEAAAAERAFFFIRNPAFAAGLDDNARADFVEADPERRRALAALKERVIGSGLKVVTYDDPDHLAVVLEQELIAALEPVLNAEPADVAADAPDAMHIAYARDRQRFYQGAERRFATLDAWARDEQSGGALLIEGPSGSGKSALMANWVAHHRTQNPSDTITLHFLGCSSDSASPQDIMRRALRQMAGALGENPEEGLEGVALAGRFVAVLERCGREAAAKSGRWIVALDGLDKLSEWDDLRWLPQSLPPGIKLVASALPGRARDAFVARGCQRHQIALMDGDEQRALVQGRLRHFAKTLAEARLARIVAHPLGRLPLFLLTIANELRIFGRNDDLDARIDSYLQAGSMPDLFDRVLARIEQECGADLVRAATSLIALSRAGLEEIDLLAITGASPLRLSAMQLGLGDGLWEHNGRLSFSHDYLREAVKTRYLKEASERSVRDRLIRHFSLDDREAPEWRDYLELSGDSWIATRHKTPPAERRARIEKAIRHHFDRTPAADKDGSEQQLQTFLIDLDEEPDLPKSLGRRTEELPYQLQAAGDWSALSRLLTNLRWFNALFARGQLELQSYWRALRSAGVAVDVEQTLCGAVDAQLPAYGKWTKRQWRLVNTILVLLHDGGWAGERCLHLMEKCVELETAIGGNVHVMAFDAQCRLAALASSLGHHRKALSLVQEAVTGHVALLGDNHPHTLDSKHRLAVALNANERSGEAKAILEDIIPKLTDAFGADNLQTLRAQRTLSNALAALGEHDRARALRDAILKQYIHLLGPDHPDTLEVMSASAIALRQTGDPAGACALQAKVLAKRREVLGDDHPQTLSSLVAYGIALAEVGDLARAERHLREAMSIARARGNHDVVHQAGRTLADALLKAGRYDDTFALESELATELEQRGDTESPKALETMLAYAIALAGRGQFAEATAKLQQVSETESKVFGATSRRALATKGALARILVNAGQPDAARRLFQDLIAAQETAFGALDEDALVNRQELLRLLNTTCNADAIALGEDLLVRRSKANGPEDGRTIDCMLALAEACFNAGQFEKSMQRYVGAFAILLKQQQDVSSDLIYRYAQACFGAGRRDEGRHVESIVVEQLKSRPDQPRNGKLTAMMQLGHIAVERLQRSDFDGAEDIVRHVLVEETKIFGPGSDQVRHTQHNLEAIARKRRQAPAGATQKPG
jgi:nephrocystin-3